MFQVSGSGGRAPCGGAWARSEDGRPRPAAVADSQWDFTSRFTGHSAVRYIGRFTVGCVRRAPRSEEDARLEPLGGEGGLADDERLAAQAEDEATSHDDKQVVVLHAEGHHELAREDEEAADGAADADPCAGRRLRAERWAVNRRINIPR